ncbi:hypothetical protein O0555_05880 [Brevibacillus laterosporus]|uniref:hypothetical protein n=1 Tax=Brevibacillus laterosporus TaxID=1465 RepID=UPI0012DDD9C8|nr:hypothetical protein [Brevibacillus laterosporus]MCR8936881.1 hypothetical protein [Brevibacillus laterosporus]MCZ0839519.1 hypothetical protein [Brevibacillus laterosporus]MED1665837.1 hypothetical protein [Brevibacillus laterosporus]MED1671191.1 hypothetical protein [Brevibacillus laterosporus]MED1717140.1 hypothetical protein [Brevibacillus laterosporus]
MTGLIVFVLIISLSLLVKDFVLASAASILVLAPEYNASLEITKSLTPTFVSS